jgi:hypothetical protein
VKHDPAPRMRRQLAVATGDAPHLRYGDLLHRTVAPMHRLRREGAGAGPSTGAPSADASSRTGARLAALSAVRVASLRSGTCTRPAAS